METRPPSPLPGELKRFKFTREQRILRRSEYQRVYHDGRRASTDVMRIHVVQTNTDSKARLGISIPGKVGKAHIRNLLKRRLREIFRLHQFELKSGSESVIVVKSGCAKLSYQELEEMLLKLFQKMRILRLPENGNVG